MITIYGYPKDLNALKEVLHNEGLECKTSPKLGFGDSLTEVISYLSVGGGGAVIAKCLIDLLKLKYAQKKIILKDNSGKEITIEANSKNEIIELLNKVSEINMEVREKSSNEEKEIK